MLKKVKIQGLFLLSFLALSIFLNGCQNQITMGQCELPSIENKNWQFRSLATSDFSFSYNDSNKARSTQKAVLWNNKVFVVYPNPDKNIVTIFQLDKKWNATVWKQFPLKNLSNNKNPMYSDAHVGVIGNKLFLDYYDGTSYENLLKHVMLVDSKGEVQSFTFSKRVQLLPSKKNNDLIFLNFMKEGLPFPHNSNLFYTLDESFKLKEIDKKGTLYFNFESSNAVSPSDTGLFFIAPLSPFDTNIKSIDRSVMRLFHFNKESLEIEEIKEFGKQYRTLIHCEENVIKTSGYITDAYYDNNKNKLYFSFFADVLFKNETSRRLSKPKPYLGSYDLNSHTLNLISADYNTPTYFLGKINNKLILLDYIDNEEKNKVMLKFTELISESEEEEEEVK